MTTTPPPGAPRTPRGFGIDYGLGLSATMIPAVSKEDSCPQAILKFYPHNSIYYRIHYGPQLEHQLMLCVQKFVSFTFRAKNIPFKGGATNVKK